MLRHIAVAAAAALALAAVSVRAQDAPPAGPRVALVIGNGAYAHAPLPNALNDAGLVAEALRSIGFDIVDGADLGQADMVRSLRDFVGKVEAAGPGTVAFVYFSGYGFAYAGDNYLAAADARLDHENDIPLDTLRLSDLLRALDGLPAQAKIVALDAARPPPFGIAGAGLAPGLAAVEAPPGTMIAYATEPGQTIVIADGPGPYGAYATAIAEMVRTPGSDIVDDFIRIRARVAQLTDGQQLPWQVSALGQPVVLVPGDVAAADNAAPPLREARPMADYGPDEGYAYAIERDDLPIYAEYVEDYPDSPYAPQIWVIIRTRREALCWMRAVASNSPPAYWTYLHRYPGGIYAGDAERGLRRLAAPLTPPAGFVPVAFAGVPAPLPHEPAAFVAFDRAHPFAPAPAVLIPRQPASFARLAPPPRQGGARLLPAAPLPAVATLTPGRRMSVVPSTPLSHSAVRPSAPLPPPSGAAIAPAIAPALDHPREDRETHMPPPSGPVFVNRAPPAAVVSPPPPVVHQPPPAVIVNRAPPPVVNRPPPVVVRPPPVVNRAPPPPPPAAARAGPPGKKCVIENGMQVCR